ncbi:MAG: DUF4097 family beta strand repeat-containing protein [Bacteroidia bacterium]|jgi:DUF4097 and DUF4098 domain-containing protein YvlB
MSQANTPMTDQELRHLLNQVLLHDADSDWTQTMIDMEAKILFSQPAMIAVPAGVDARMMKELNYKLSAKSLLKWLFILTAVISVTAGVLYWNRQPVEEQTLLVKPVVPQNLVEPLLPSDEPLKPSSKNILQAQPATAPEELPIMPEAVTENQDLFPRFAATIPAFATPHEENNGILAYPLDANNIIQIDTLFSGIHHLDVHGMICDIKVRGTNTSQTSLKGRIMYESGNKKKETGDAFKIMVERNGDVLKVWLEQKRKTRWITFSNSIRWEGLLEFELPANTNIKLRSSSGRTDVSGMQGNQCDLENSYGPLYADSISTNLRVKSSSGDITLRNITGNIDATALYGSQTIKQIKGNLVSNSSSGDVSITEITGNTNVEALYGNIHVIKAEGNVQITSSSGNVSLKSVHGDVCTVEASYGNITASQIQAKLEVHTKSGNINLHGISGFVKAVSLYGTQHISDINGDVLVNSSSGEVTLEDATGFADIHTLYGNIVVNDCTGNLKLEASSGSIKANQVMIKDSANLKTGYGDISVDLLNNQDDLSYDVLTDYGSVRIHGQSMANDDKRSRVFISKGPKLIRSYSQSGNQQFE